MKLLDFIKSKDTANNIIYTDEWNEQSGVYINLTELDRYGYADPIISILCYCIPNYRVQSQNTPSSKDNIQYIDGEAFEFLRKTELVIDEEVSNYSSFVRRPYFQLRGKRITEEQAFEVIRKTDRFFQWDMNKVESIDIVHFPNWWLNRNHHPTHYGWCHPSGIIGLNGITDTYPTISELLGDMLRLKFAFSYLDFVVAITNWNESPDEGEDDSDLFKNIEIGIWVHDDTIEFMSPAKTEKIYNQYASKYEEPNKGLYVPEYYQDNKIYTADLSYLKRCIRAYGLNPDEELSKIREYIWKN